MIMNELVTNGTIYALTGAFAGLASGLFGIGGGIVVVPVLAYIFQQNALVPENMVMQMAAATSLAVMIFTSQSTIRAYMKRGAILWPRFNTMVAGIVLGTILGVILANYVPTKLLRVIFGVFLFMVAVEMIINIKVVRKRKRPARWLHSSVSSLIGFKSGLLGVGGGAVVIPYLSWCGVNARKVAAIAALCTMTVSLIGTATFILTSYKVPDLPPYSLGYVYWPSVLLVAIPSVLFAPVGARISHDLPLKKLKIAFSIVLVFTAIDLIIK